MLKKKEVVKWKFYVMPNTFLYQDRKKSIAVSIAYSAAEGRRWPTPEDPILSIPIPTVKWINLVSEYFFQV